MTEQNMVPSVQSTLRLLELLAKEQFRSASLTKIAIELSISKSTCLRILKH
ncbi:MAG: hypothetical protein K0Q73_2805 [Paenibacillus sp.]|nr:hypothetical protein [Paenibacillus sp.]